MPDLDGHPIPRRAWRFRLKVAAKRTLGVAALVALVVVQGCTTAPSGNDSPAPPAAPPPTPTPPPAPTPPPTPPPPTNFDGTYGPGTFAWTHEGCGERFFSPTFSASVEVANNMTSVTIVDSVRRASTCVVAAASVTRCTGSGQIAGGEPATWERHVQFFSSSSGSPSAIVLETVQFPRWGNCVVAHEGRALVRQ